MLLAILALLVLTGVRLDAQTEIPWRSVAWAEDFSAFQPGNYFLGTNTVHDAAEELLLLTPYEPSRSGRLMLPRLLPIRNFDVSFRARFGFNGAANMSGADGIVFVMAAIYDYPPTGGGELNFDGCLGYGIEFDTYENNDRNDATPEHIAVIRDRSSNHLFTQPLPVPTLEDDAWHQVLIRFRSGSVAVFLDGNPRLAFTIPAYFPFDGFFGFSSATGSAFNEHRLDDIRLEMPTRTAMDFGVVSLCDPVLIDTSILVRNNHPDGEEFTITALNIQTVTPGVFTLPQVPVPSVVPHGSRVRIPIRIAPVSEGSYTAVLEIVADNGERIYDTLRIAAELPRLAWTPQDFDFPITWVGSDFTTVLTLRNVGSVPASVTGLRWAAGSGVFTAQAALPAVLQPGDSLAVSVRFTPTAAENYLDSLYAVTGCGAEPGARIRGTGDDERMLVSLVKPLVLSPGETDQLILRLDSIPDRYAVFRITGEIRIDADFVAFAGVERNDEVLSPTADLDVTFQGDRAEFHLERYTPFDRTGALFSVGLTALQQGPECRTVQLENMRVIGQGGINRSADGRVCINPSCRHPDGLFAAVPPAMRVYPHPVRGDSRIVVTLAREERIRLSLVDLAGEERRVLASTVLSSGEHGFPLLPDGLATGAYILRLEWSGGIEARSIVIPR